MLYDVVYIADIGTHWQVDGVMKSDLTFIHPGRQYMKVSYMAALEIKKELVNGNTVTIAKNLQKSEISLGDFSVNLSEGIDIARNIALSAITSTVDAYLVTLSMMEFFNFINLNNIFIEKGIIITEDNREEKYLEIINKEDPKLIESLEKYLEAKDRISQVYWRYEKVEEFKKELMSLTDEKEIESLKNQTLSAIKNP